MTTPSDGELVKRTLQGDEEAFEELTIRYKTFVRGIVMNEFKSNDIDDIVQDVFLRAWQTLPLIKYPERFKWWIATIARNKAIDHRRKSRRLQQYVSEDPLDSSQMYDQSVPDTEVLFTDAEYARQILDSLKKESPKPYQCLLLYVEGYGLEEIARRVGITTESVPVYISTARKKARKIRAKMLEE